MVEPNPIVSGEKKLFMSAIASILKAKPMSIEIIRENKMLNMRTIERSSKSTKDPNPLATTLNLMGTKYPLSIDKDRAKKFKIPKEFSPANTYLQEDYHKHNRILAKNRYYRLVY